MVRQVKTQGAYKVQDAMEFLGVSRATLYNYMKSGKLPYRKMGHLVRFLPQDLRIFLDRNKVDNFANQVTS